MPWNQQHAKKTQKRILDSAGELFARKGYKEVSINEIMKVAGLTRGAFYSHFSSKSDLYAKSIVNQAILTGQKIQSKNADKLGLQSIMTQYLCMEHRNGDDYSCPMAFLITDVTQRDSSIRDTYTQILKQFVEFLDGFNSKEDGDVDQSKSLQIAVMMIGGLAIARAVNDDEFSEAILCACREMLE